MSSVTIHTTVVVPALSVRKRYTLWVPVPPALVVHMTTRVYVRPTCRSDYSRTSATRNRRLSANTRTVVVVSSERTKPRVCNVPSVRPDGHDDDKACSDSYSHSEKLFNSQPSISATFGVFLRHRDGRPANPSPPPPGRVFPEATLNRANIGTGFNSAGPFTVGRSFDLRTLHDNPILDNKILKRHNEWCGVFITRIIYPCKPVLIKLRIYLSFCLPVYRESDLPTGAEF